LESPIGTLSKGQRKRALLAIGLVAPQPMLLADEPFDGLDLRQSREVALTLRSYAAQGRTLFLSIHQLGDAARVCDRFVLRSGGGRRRGVLAARRHLGADLQRLRAGGGIPAAVRRHPARDRRPPERRAEARAPASDARFHSHWR